jgi:MFS family permease
VPKRELVGSLAWLTMAALLGPVCGPPVGGYITTYFTWRWIFWINIPVGILGLLLATLYIPDIYGDRRTAFDYRGFILSAVGLAAFITGSTSLGLDLARARPHAGTGHLDAAFDRSGPSYPLRVS